MGTGVILPNQAGFTPILSAVGARIEHMFPSEIPAMSTESLGSEICSLGAHIAAATCRWLLLIGEFDRRSGAGDWECRSTSHWLSWRCGMSLMTAREHVRVALRLAELPVVTEAFRRGELSYSHELGL